MNICVIVWITPWTQENSCSHMRPLCKMSAPGRLFSEGRAWSIKPTDIELIVQFARSSYSNRCIRVEPDPSRQQMSGSSFNLQGHPTATGVSRSIGHASHLCSTLSRQESATGGIVNTPDRITYLIEAKTGRAVQMQNLNQHSMGVLANSLHLEEYDL